MKFRLIIFALSLSCLAFSQNFENKFSRPLGETLDGISKRFGVKLSYDIDTVGKVVPFADFRIRPYSVEESLRFGVVQVRRSLQTTSCRKPASGW